MTLYSGWAWDAPFRAAIDLSSYQYCFVVSGSVEGEVTLAASAGGSVLGVLQNDPTAGEEATVRIFGTSKVKVDASGSSASLNAWIKTSAKGEAVGAKDMVASSWAVGLCLKTVTTSSAYTEVLLWPQGARF